MSGTRAFPFSSGTSDAPGNVDAPRGGTGAGTEAQSFGPIVPPAPEPGGGVLPVGCHIGPYLVIRLLGSGSSGRVYEVEHEKIGRRAAMKVLSPEHAARPDAVRRLLAEAQAVNRISDPHIVEITDVVEGIAVTGADGAQMPGVPVNAIVMELLEGLSLGQMMLRFGPLPAVQFLPIMAQACDALAAAHGVGFVHRDLKPDNIYIVEHGGEPQFVKLLDFGIAKSVDASDSGLATVENAFAGTPAYVSPEQAAGRALDLRSDIYSVGVMLFELAAGRLPFEGSNIGDFLVKHLTVPPPSLPSELLGTRLGRYLNAVIHRCLQKDPARRFASAGQLAEVLRALARGEIPQAPDMEEYLRRGSAGAGRRVLAYVGVWGVVALITGGALHLSSILRAPRPAPAAVARAATVNPTQTVVADTAQMVRRDVTLVFESDPPGAEARLQGRDGLLGITPFLQSFARSNEPLVIDIRMAGRKPRQLIVVPDENHTLSVHLPKASAGGRRQTSPVRSAVAPRRSGSHGASRESTIDPFAR